MATDTRDLDSLKEVLASEILAKIEKGEPVDYEDSIIIGDLDARGLNLQKSNNGKSIIESSIAIRRSVIEGDVYFDHAIFQNYVQFWETKFNRSTMFWNSEFNNDVLFWVDHFEWSCFFDNAHFKEIASFSGSTFNEDAHFFGAHFDRYTNLEANFLKDLILERTKIYLMQLNEATFSKGSVVLLKNSDFFRLELPWAQIRENLRYDGGTYLALTRNYNNLEWFEDADNCYYQYRSKRRATLNGSSEVLDWIAWVTYGYGIRFYYPLLLGVSLFFFSAGVFFFGNQVHSIMEAFDLSAVILTTTTQIGNLTGFYRLWSILERIFGWLLMASFLVVLARKTIR
ncbi:MAG: pentapeptide repeat-containing protein [Methanothrix sp.]